MSLGGGGHLFIFYFISFNQKHARGDCSLNKMLSQITSIAGQWVCLNFTVVLLYPAMATVKMTLTEIKNLATAVDG